MSLTNERFQIKSYPSPLVTDVLFYEIRDNVLPKNKQPTYGEAHPNPVLWPNHILTLIEPMPRSGDGKQLWWYAATRDSQNLYNYSFSQADIGGTKFDSVTREYVTLRSEFNSASPAMGSAMVDEPAGIFSGSYVLAERQQVQHPSKEISSMFILERRTYVKKVTLRDNEYSQELEQNLSSTQTLYYRGETISGNAIETLVADEDNAYWGLTGTTARSAKQLSDNWFLVTEQKVSVRVSPAGVYSDDWPLKQIKERGSAAEVPALFADQVSSIETITKEDIPLGEVDDLPDPGVPTGTQAKITHKKVSDLHYEQIVLEKEFTLTNEIVKTDVDQKPYVTIIQSTRGQETQEIPATGIGSSELVWKAGDQRLYANMDQDSIARPGLKGFDKSVQQWGDYTERTDYSENYADGETSRVIYDDGETRVYEVTNLTEVNASGTTLDKDPQQWGFAVWNGEYSTDVNALADRSRQVWRRGSYQVFLNEVVTAVVSGTTRDKDPQQWGDLLWTGTYSDIQNLNADRSKQVWRVGENYVFLNEEAEVTVGGTTKDIDPQQWGTLTWDGTYATASGGDRSRQVWRLGDNTVFLNETVTVSVDGTTLDKDPQQWGSLRWDGTYAIATSETADRSRQVWRLGSNAVFLNETATPDVSGGTLDKDPQQWGSAKWTGTYRSNPEQATIDASDRARQVWRLGANTVYLTEDVAAEVSGGTFDRDPQQWGDLTWEGLYHLNPLQATIETADRSRQVWRVGDQTVYLLEDATATPSGTTQDKDPQQWGSLTWNGAYSSTAGANVGDQPADRFRQVWRLGAQAVFLNEAVSVDVSGTTKDKDPQQWGSLVWDGAYSETAGDAITVDGVPKPADRYRQVWRLGTHTVYLNEAVTVSFSGSTKELDPQQWGEITWTGTYSSTADTGAARYRQVWKLDDNVVYLNETAGLVTDGTTKDIDPKEWGSLKWEGTYSETIPTVEGSDTRRIRSVYYLNGVNVYLIETPTLDVESETYISYSDENAVLTETHYTSYGTAAGSPTLPDGVVPPAGSLSLTRSRVVFALGTSRVFENTKIIKSGKAETTYQSLVSVNIPPVLLGITTVPFFRRDGDDSYQLNPQIQAGYEGAMPCTVTEYWSSSPNLTDVPITFKPEPVVFSSPLGSFSVGATLHGPIEFQVVVGTQHPTFKFATYTGSYAATTPATVPASFLARVDAAPYEGGYVIRKYTVDIVTS